MKSKCGNCGKQFELEDKRKKYCSRECSSEGARKKQDECIKRYYQKNSAKRFMSVCKKCGKKIRNGANYCSNKACKQVYISIYMRERYRKDEKFRDRILKSSLKYNKSHPRKKKPVLPRECKICRKIFVPKNGHTKYCSEKCLKTGKIQTLQKYYNNRVRKIKEALK